MRSSVILLLVWVARCFAGTYGWDAPVGSSCYRYFLKFDFGGCDDPLTLQKCLFGNQAYLGSILQCGDEYSRSEREKRETFSYFRYRASLRKYNYSTQDFDAILQNATQYLIPASEAANLTAIYSPVEADHPAFMTYRNTYDEMKKFAKIDTKWLGWGLVWFWVVVILCYSIVNLEKRLLGLKPPRTASQFMRKHLTYTSTFKKTLPGFLPTRLHSILICVFMIQVVLSSCIGYEFTFPSPYLVKELYIAYMVQHRTGMFSLYMYPLLTLFGVRNNPLINATGLSFTEFISFHKLFGIVMAVMATVHGIAWTYYAAKSGRLAVYEAELYWRWGIVAACAAGLMCVHSLKLIRNYAYESFLLLHNIFGIFVIVGTWLHLEELGYRGFIFAMLAIWCIDRVLRILRIFLSGGLQKVEIEMCDAEVLKITMQKPKFFKYYPGSYAFVSFSKPWYFMWQFHPFTAVSSPVEGESTLAFYVKAKKGLTRSLARLDFNEKSRISMSAIVEGPYGSSTHICAPTTRYVGLSTGLGISGVIPALFQHVNRTRNVIREIPSSGKSKDSSEELSLTSAATTLSELYWIVQDARHIQWMHETLNYLAQNGCRVVVLVTKSGGALEDAAHYTVKTVGGRPDVAGIVMQTVQECESRGQDVSFCTCGSDSFNTAVRDAVAENITVGSNIDIEHVSEAHTW